MLRKRRSRFEKDKLKIIYQEKPNCPIEVHWMGCGNIQYAPVDSASVYTGDFAGESARPFTYFISFPKNEITVRALSHPGRVIINCNPCSSTYKQVFKFTSTEAVENTSTGYWLIAQARIKACPSCKDSMFIWCPTSDKCRNGVIVTYDGVLPLIDFINIQTPGTTILLPDGTYLGGDITVDYVIVNKEDPLGTVTLTTPLVDTTPTQQVIVDLD